MLHRGDANGFPVEEDADADEHRGGSRCGDPAARGARRRGAGGVARCQNRERDHACRMAQMFETAGDVLLLRTEPLRREDRISFAGSFAAEASMNCVSSA